MAYGSSIRLHANRRSNRQARRDAEAAIKTGTQAWMILLAALEHAGGELPVSKAAIDNAGTHLHTRDFTIIADRSKPIGEGFLIRLNTFTEKPITDSTPADAPCTITRVDESGE